MYCTKNEGTPSGAITGSPTLLGTYQFGFIVRDAAGNSAQLNEQLQVVTLGPNPTATLGATPLQFP